MKISKSVFFQENINKFNVEIVDGGYLDGDTEWKGTGICSPFSRLYYVKSGRGIVEYGSQKIVLEPGKLFLIPMGLTFNYYCDDNIDKLWFHINIYCNDGYDVLNGYGKCIVNPVPLAEINQIIDLYNTKSLLSVFTVKQKVMSHVISMLSEVSMVELFKKEYSPMVQKAIDYILQNLSVKLSVKELAERLFVSKGTLYKRFHEEVGVTLGKYIDDQVFFATEKLLLTSKLSIAQISATFDFCDQFYFTRKFKKRNGLTPTEYRKKNGEVL